MEIVCDIIEMRLCIQAGITSSQDVKSADFLLIIRVRFALMEWILRKRKTGIFFSCVDKQ